MATSLTTRRIGMNLGAVVPYTDECPFIDRMRMSSDPTAVKGQPLVPFDPATGLATEAGVMVRSVPVDPIDLDLLPKVTSHDYVIHCDANVSEVRTPWAWLKPKDGHAVLTVKSASTGAPLEIYSSGPVRQFHFMRAEHEVAWGHGAILNPDFVKAVKPFPMLRLLDWPATNEADWPERRPLPSDAYFTNMRGGLPADFAAMLAKTTGAEIWYTIHPKMPDRDVIDIAHTFAAWGARVRFEWGNELGWTFQRDWMTAQTIQALSKPKVAYIDKLRFYGQRAAHLAKLVCPISPFFRVELASQGSDGVSNLPPILRGWDEVGAPRSWISGYACASYLNLNGVIPQLLAAMAKDDKNGFYDLVRGLMPALQARHVKAITACKAAGLAYDIYEGGPSLYTTRATLPDEAARAQRGALLAWAMPLFHHVRMAEIEMKMIRDVLAAGAAHFCRFQMSGRGTQYGIWGTMPHITLPPYPVYGMLAAG
jgi:hypothetical protein